jgi:hypothetical protein
MESFLTYDPTERITVRNSCRHAYFSCSPRACLPSLLPTFPEFRNFKKQNVMEERKRLEDVKIARDLERAHEREFNEVVGGLGVPIIKRYGS